MKKFITFGFIISIILVLLSPLASSFPDGLERVSELFHFSEKSENLISSPIPDYSLPFIKSDIFSTIFAGLIGVALIFILLYLSGILFKKLKV